jgi:8-oxo-dGTP pyrophosphatase MutT (NUDIX family)
MPFLDRFAPFGVDDLPERLAFFVDNHEVGYATPDFVRTLQDFPHLFDISAESFTLAESLHGFDARSKAFDHALRHLAKQGAIKGWRDELYPVRPTFSGPAFFTMERAAVPLFGIRACGVHMNGFVRDTDGLKMWIGRRSQDRAVAPGKLDQIVAGGQPAGLSIKANLIKEAQEEAGIPADLLDKAKPVGGLSYCLERPEGLRRDFLFLYDLELPGDFHPVNQDGELAEFYLWPIERVIEAVRDSDDFKFNCALVVIDFLIRHGFIEADHPDYPAIVTGLKTQPSCARPPGFSPPP